MNDDEAYEDLVTKVVERTRGTEGDPLSRAEVAQVVSVTLAQLGLDARGKPREPNMADEEAAARQEYDGGEDAPE